MTIVKSHKHIDLIEIAEGLFCVRRRFKSWLGKPKCDYYQLNIRGTDLTFPDLVGGATVSDRDRAEYIFNCNAIAAGAL